MQLVKFGQAKRLLQFIRFVWTVFVQKRRGRDMIQDLHGEECLGQCDIHNPSNAIKSLANTILKEQLAMFIRNFFNSKNF